MKKALVAVIAGSVLVGIAGWAQSWRMRVLQNAEDTTASLQTECESLRGELVRSRRERQVALDQADALATAVSEADGRAEQERGLQEPLREHLAQMSGRLISAEAEKAKFVSAAQRAQRRVGELETSLEQEKQVRAELEARVRAGEQQLSDQKTSTSERDEALRVARAQLQELTSLVEELKSHLQSATEEQARTGQQCDTLKQQLAAAEQAQAALLRECAALKQQIATSPAPAPAP